MNALRTLALLMALLAPPLAWSAGMVNINTADAETLAASLSGVGMSRAQAIVDYRGAHGPFKSVEDLATVRGIGMKIVERNRSSITLGKQ